MNKTRIVLLAASISLAMLSTLGCAGSSGQSTSPSKKWVRECQKIGTVYCGIGIGVSTSEQMANDMARTNAVTQLASDIRQDIDAKLKNADVNVGTGRAGDGNKADMVSANERIRKVSMTLNGIKTQDIDVQFINGEYQVYVFVTRSIEETLDQAKQELLQDAELKELEHRLTKALTINAAVKELHK